MIEDILNSLAHEICKRNGYPEKYDIVVTMDLESTQCVVIKGGETPIIYVNKIWILHLLFESEKELTLSSKKLKLFPLKDALSRALKRAPRMTRSLSLLTIKEAIELRIGAKKWAETIVPELKSHLRDRFFEVKYEVKITVRETTTNTSITRTISRPEEIQNTIRESKDALSRSIIDNEEMSELRRIADFKEDTKNIPVIPNSVIISVDEETKSISERMVY